MRRRWPAGVALFLAFAPLSLAAIPAAGQGDCPRFDRESIQQAQRACPELSEGKLCAGSGMIRARTTGSARIDLELSPGEMLDFAAVDWIDSASGLALGLLPAYAVDSWQVHPADVLLFGDVSLFRVKDPVNSLDASVAPRQGANLRARPADTAPILGTAAQGDSLRLTGRSQDGGWLRAQLTDGRSAWIAAVALVEQDFSALEVVQETSEALPLLSMPFQNNEFGSGVEQGPCRERDQAGILLQSAADGPALRWMANGVALRWRGTALLQAYPDDFLRLAALEGSVEIAWRGQTMLLPAGYMTEALLREPEPGEENIRAPRRYDVETMYRLPLPLLPRLIYPAADLRAWIAPRPVPDRSPLDGMLATDTCRITTGPGGSNLRAGPGREYPVRGVMDFRESAAPVGRAIASDGSLWWRIAPFVWVSAATTVTGGDCVAIPQAAPDALGP